MGLVYYCVEKVSSDETKISSHETKISSDEKKVSKGLDFFETVISVLSTT